MVIDPSNCETGNRAMASALLLCGHLLQESGITNEQTADLDGRYLGTFPEAGEMAGMRREGEARPDDTKRQSMLGHVFHRYVVDGFRRMLPTPA